ncbi:MAG: hypothetical protein E7376_04365 [Clostridiales bacterium]|nr:hypothetical protein [Clostridiales bacterium]
MKKNYKWLINLATLVLCVCALAIGVYAAKQASLTATGTIGFTAHGCKVKVSGTIDAYDEDFTTKLTGTEATIAETLVDEEGEELSLPAMYFSDLAEEGNTITINLKITSDSDFPVLCNIPNPVAYDSNSTTTEITAVKGLTSNQSFVLSTKGEYKDITITFTLTDIETASEISAIFDANLEFKKYTFDRSVLKTGAMSGLPDETEKAKTKLYVEMGEYTVGETTTPLRWYAFAYSATGSEEVGANGMVAVNEFTATDSTSVPAGTYYFISEYILKNTDSDYIAFNSSMTEINDYGIHYNNSTIQNYVNGTTGLYTKYNFGADKYSGVYGQITTRTLGGEDYKVYDSDYLKVLSESITQSTANQSLWLLNTSEYNGLLTKAQGDAKLLEGSVGCWWLRSLDKCSPSAGSSYACYIDWGGAILFATVNRDVSCGIRPAFKLVIA